MVQRMMSGSSATYWMMDIVLKPQGCGEVAEKVWQGQMGWNPASNLEGRELFSLGGSGERRALGQRELIRHRASKWQSPGPYASHSQKISFAGLCSSTKPINW